MRFCIIDLNNLYFRSIHSTGKTNDAFTRAGMSLHIIFNSLRKLYTDLKVDHFVFAMDDHSWRYEIFPQYKAKRKAERLSKSPREKEDDEVLLKTLQDFVEFVSEQSRCTVLKCRGVEADDFVARWIQLHPEDDHIILSGDSDFIQLLAPNVTIRDGVNERDVSIGGVTNFNGEPMVFSLDSSSGRLKVKSTVAEAKKEHDKVQKEKERAHNADQKARAKAHDAAQKILSSDPAFVPSRFVAAPYGWQEFSFSPEPDWWRKALFIKCVRGDSGDGIFSAYPGARYIGTSQRTGICEAWDDRNGKGFNFNNFMLQRWDKLIAVENGERLIWHRGVGS